jgi:hypothetical protein
MVILVFDCMVFLFLDGVALSFKTLGLCSFFWVHFPIVKVGFARFWIELVSVLWFLFVRLPLVTQFSWVYSSGKGYVRCTWSSHDACFTVHGSTRVRFV